MAEKKATRRVAAPKKAVAAVAAPKRSAAKKAEVVINSESVGFRAGDVYQALAAAGKALSVADIAKAANISTEEAYLGIGWLFEWRKGKDENALETRA